MYASTSATTSARHHVERLAEGHALARRIGEGMSDLPIVARVLPIDTNIVIADLAPSAPDARAVLAHLKAHDVRAIATGERQLRIVTHMDVGVADAEALLSALAGLPTEKA